MTIDEIGEPPPISCRISSSGVTGEIAIVDTGFNAVGMPMPAEFLKDPETCPDGGRPAGSPSRSPG